MLYKRVLKRSFIASLKWVALRITANMNAS